MNDDRERQLTRQLNLLAKPLALQFRIGVVVMVIEADLAVRHHLAVVRQFPEFIIPIGGDVFDFVGVHTDRSVDEWVVIRERNR